MLRKKGEKVRKKYEFSKCLFIISVFLVTTEFSALHYYVRTTVFFHFARKKGAIVTFELVLNEFDGN